MRQTRVVPEAIFWKEVTKEPQHPIHTASALPIYSSSLKLFKRIFLCPLFSIYFWDLLQIFCENEAGNRLKGRQDQWNEQPHIKGDTREVDKRLETRDNIHPVTDRIWAHHLSFTSYFLEEGGSLIIWKSYLAIERWAIPWPSQWHCHLLLPWGQRLASTKLSGLRGAGRPSQKDLLCTFPSGH